MATSPSVLNKEIRIIWSGIESVVLALVVGVVVGELSAFARFVGSGLLVGIVEDVVGFGVGSLIVIVIGGAIGVGRVAGNSMFTWLIKG